MNIITRVINDKTFWIHVCPECGRDMPYSQKSNFYHARKHKKRCQSCANPMKRSEISAKFLGDLNPAKRKSFREWMSKNNPMYKQNVIEKQKIGANNPNKVESARARMKENNPSKNKKFLEKRIDTYTKRLSEGKYTIKNNWKTGYYDKKDGTKEWYDSSYELSKMIEYDARGVQWTKKHKLRIPYVNEAGLKTYYVPDFLVNGNRIEEVKGWLSQDAIIKAKLAIQYCKSIGFDYSFFLGKNLENQHHLSYTHDST